GDEIHALVVRLIDEAAVARIGVLGDFADEGAVVEAIDFLKLLLRFRTLENVATDVQHPQRPPDLVRQGGEQGYKRNPWAAAYPGTLTTVVDEITGRGPGLQGFAAYRGRNCAAGALNLLAFACWEPHTGL